MTFLEFVVDQIASIGEIDSPLERERRLPACLMEPEVGYVTFLAGADGVWWDVEIHAWRDGRGRRLRYAPDVVPLEAIRVTRKPVYLATAHLNHDPTFSGPRWRNLAALCQRCHMIHDAAEHRRRRWWNAFRVRALGDLFSGRYS